MRASLKLHPLPQEYEYMHFHYGFTDFFPQPIAGVYSGRIPVRKNGLCGFLDCFGKLVVPCIYESVSRFQRGMSLVLGTNDRYGYVRLYGGTIPCIYNGAESFYPYTHSRRWAMVHIGLKYGTVGEEGQLESCRFDEIKDHGVRTGEKWGLIHTSGYIGVPCIYDELGEADGNVVPVRQGNCWGLLHTSGRIFTAPVFGSMQRVDDFFVAQKGNVGALFLSAGNLLLEEEGLNAENYAARLLKQHPKKQITLVTEDGYANLEAKEQNGAVRWKVFHHRMDNIFMDAVGPCESDFYDRIVEVAPPTEQEDIQPYLEQERREDGCNFLYGLRDKKGAEVLPAQYRWLRATEGLIGPIGYTAWKDGTWYFIEINLEVIPATPAR